MKLSPIIFAALLSLVLATDSFSQCADSTGHYSFALFGGTFIGYQKDDIINDFLNSVTLEMEYRKSENWAFFANATYTFTDGDLKTMLPEYNLGEYVITQNPAHHIGKIDLGGRYYLSSAKVNTYINFGISHHFEYIGPYKIEIHNYPGSEPIKLEKSDKDWFYGISAFAGAGLNIKLSKKFNLEFQYNLYRNIEKSDGNMRGFTVQSGLRYVL